MIKFGLTEAETRALAAIRDGLSAGHCPTRSELADLLGLRSKSGAQNLVDALIAKGHLMRLPHRNRALVGEAPDGRGAPALQDLPLEVEAALDDFCQRHGEARGAVMADAIILHIDQVDAACEHWGDA